MNVPPDERVRCPWCAEEILAVARKCKHCGEFLEQAPRSVGIPQQEDGGVGGDRALDTSALSDGAAGQLLDNLRAAAIAYQIEGESLLVGSVNEAAARRLLEDARSRDAGVDLAVGPYPHPSSVDPTPRSSMRRTVLIAVTFLLLVTAGALVVLSLAGNDGPAPANEAEVVDLDPATTDECYVQTTAWVARIVDAVGTSSDSASLGDMVKEFGTSSDRYRSIIAMYPEVVQEQYRNGTTAAVELLDQLARSECGLPHSSG